MRRTTAGGDIETALDDAAAKNGLQRVWFATGEDELLLQVTEATVDTLEEHGFDVTRCADGGHTWINRRMSSRRSSSGSVLRARRHDATTARHGRRAAVPSEGSGCPNGQLKRPGHHPRLGRMLRLTQSLLILCVLANGVDAAVDGADVLVGETGSSHEMHEPHQGDPDRQGDPTPSGGDGDPAKQHFCHCAAHMPPLAPALPTAFSPVHADAPDDVSDLPIRSPAPPPVRPPKR